MGQRRKYLINPSFQLRFISWMFGIFVVISLVFYSAHLYFFNKYLLLGKKVGLPQDHVFFAFVMDQYREMNWIFAVTLLISFTLIFGIGLLLSHRIAGPINRLCEHMNACGSQKRLMEVRFRSDDYFPELGKAFNKYSRVISDKLEEFKPIEQNHKK